MKHLKVVKMENQDSSSYSSLGRVAETAFGQFWQRGEKRVQPGRATTPSLCVWSIASAVQGNGWTKATFCELSGVSTPFGGLIC